MKPLGWLATVCVELLVQVFVWVCMPLLAMGYFVIFDFFHITMTWIQVTLVVAPLLILAGFLWRYREEIERQSAPSTKAYDEAKANTKTNQI